MIIKGKEATIELTEASSFAFSDEKMEFHIWYYGVMALVPCSIATYNFTLGYLRGLNPKFIPFYMTFLSIIIYGSLM